MYSTALLLPPVSGYLHHEMPLSFLSAFRTVSLPVPDPALVLSSHLGSDGTRERDCLAFTARCLQLTSGLAHPHAAVSAVRLAVEAAELYRGLDGSGGRSGGALNKRALAEALHGVARRTVHAGVAPVLLSIIGHLPGFSSASDWVGEKRKAIADEKQEEEEKEERGGERRQGMGRRMMDFVRECNARGKSCLILYEEVAREDLMDILFVLQGQGGGGGGGQKERDLDDGLLPVVSINTYPSWQMFGPVREPTTVNDDADGSVHEKEEEFILRQLRHRMQPVHDASSAAGSPSSSQDQEREQEERGTIFVLGWPEEAASEAALCRMLDSHDGRDGDGVFPNLCFLCSAKQLPQSRMLRSRVMVMNVGSLPADGFLDGFIELAWPKEVAERAKVLFEKLLSIWEESSSTTIVRRNESHRRRQMTRLLGLLKSRADEENWSRPDFACNALLHAFLWSFGLDSVDLQRDQSGLASALMESLDQDRQLTFSRGQPLSAQHFDTSNSRWVSSGDQVDELTWAVHHMLSSSDGGGGRSGGGGGGGGGYPVAFVGRGFHRTLADKILDALASEENYQVVRTTAAGLRSSLLQSSEGHNSEGGLKLMQVNEWELRPHDDTGSDLAPMLLLVDCDGAAPTDLSLLQDLALGLLVFRQKDRFEGRRIRGVRIALLVDRSTYLRHLTSTQEDYFQGFHALVVEEVDASTSFGYISLSQEIRDKMQTSLSLLKDLKATFLDQESSDVALLKMCSADSFSRVFLLQNFLDWESNLVSLLYFPLFLQESRRKMGLLLSRGRTLPLLDKVLDPDVSQVVSNITFILSYCLENARRPVCLLGHAGLGSGSSLAKQVCRKLNKKVAERAFLSPVDEGEDPGSEVTLVSLGILSSDHCEQLSSFFDSLGRDRRAIITAPLEPHSETWVRFVRLVSRRAVVVSIPEWSAEDYQSLDKVPGIPQEINERLIAIHMKVMEHCKRLSCHPPTVSLFLLVCKVAGHFMATSESEWSRQVQLLRNLLQKLNDFNRHVEELERQISDVCAAINKEKELKEEAEVTQKELNILLEDSNSHLASFESTINDLKEQLAGLEADKVNLLQKASLKFEVARQKMREGVREEDINLLLANQQHLSLEENQHIGAMLAAVLDSAVPTEEEEMGFTARLVQLKSPEYMQRLLETTNPLDIVHPVMLFLQGELRELESKLEKKGEEEPLPEVLAIFVQYFEGLNEILSFKDDYSEINVRVHECQLQLSDHQSRQQEVVRRREEEQVLRISEVQQRKDLLGTKVAALALQEERLLKDISGARAVSQAFAPLARTWEAQLRERLKEEKTIKVKATLKSVVQCYLRVLPQRIRQAVVEDCMAVLSPGTGTAEEERLTIEEDIRHSWTPWRSSNLAETKELPGWKQGFAPKVCVVLDPHDVATELLTFGGESSSSFSSMTGARRRRPVAVLHILAEEDLGRFDSLVHTEELVVVVPQFRWQHVAHVRDAIDSKRSSSDVCVFLLVTEDQPYRVPKDAFFLDLTLTPLEAALMLWRFVDGSGEEDEERKARKAERRRQLEALKMNVFDMALGLSPAAAPKPEEVSAMAKRMEELADNDDNEMGQAGGGEDTPPRDRSPEQLPKELWLPASILCASVMLSGLLGYAQVSVASFLRCVRLALSSREANAMRRCFHLVAFQYPEAELKQLKIFSAMYLSFFKGDLSRADIDHVLGFLDKCSMEEREEEEEEVGRQDRPDFISPATWRLLSETELGGRRLSEVAAEEEEVIRHWWTGDGEDEDEDHLVPLSRGASGSEWTKLLLSAGLRPKRLSAMTERFLRDVGCPLSSEAWRTDLIRLDTLLSEQEGKGDEGEEEEQEQEEEEGEEKEREERAAESSAAPSLPSLSSLPVLLRVADSFRCHEDPAVEVRGLAMQVGLTRSKLKFFSVTSVVTAAEVEHALCKAIVRGHWLVFTNVELSELVLRHCCKLLAENTSQRHK